MKMKLGLTLFLLSLLGVINLIFGKYDATNATKSARTSFRGGRANLIAFKPFGNNVNVGLDLLLPFVKVPIKRQLDENGQEKALLTVNTAAVTIAGLISGFGLFLGHLLRSITTLQGRENGEIENNSKESAESQSAEHRLDFGIEGNRFSRAIEPLKFVYRNSSGGRVDITLESLLNTIEDNVLDDNVDLAACIQKSICTFIKRSSLNVIKGDASPLESIVDGLFQMDWLLNFMRQTAIEEAINAGKSDACFNKYPTCHWSKPDQRLLHLIGKRVRFV